MKRMFLLCSILVACGGGSGGGGYDQTMQRLMTAQPSTMDDTVVGVWTDPSTSLVAVVTKDADQIRAVLVNGQPVMNGTETVPVLTSLEGGKVDSDAHRGALATFTNWGRDGKVGDFKIYLMAGGQFKEANDSVPCSSSRGYQLDYKKDKSGKPVLWISMYGGTGAGFPRTLYFQKASDTIDAAAMAKIKDAKNYCETAAAAPAAPPT